MRSRHARTICPLERRAITLAQQMKRDSASMPVRARWKPWLLMAVLAVLSLGATVFVAVRALSDASDVVIRGEGDVLMSTVASDLAQEPKPLSAQDLQRVLDARASSGLRYLAVVDREGRPSVEAGSAQMPGVMTRPGQAVAVGQRVRVMAPVGRPRRGPFNERGERGERPPGMMGLPLLVIELEPPVIATLRAHLERIAIVATVAGAILIAFAIAWSRSAARLAAIEARTTHEQRLVALGSMSSVMAHELRNPLASLKGHAQLLVEDLEEPQKRAKAERVVKEAERLELLTTSLLDFVRDGPIERISTPTRELVDRAIEGLARSRVDIRMSDAPERVLVDADRLARALHNVVDNALQATSDGEPIELSIETIGNEVAMTVRDHGVGIPPGSESQIFEPFHTTRTKGTGLGLAVARRILEQHGGSLTGENHRDGGAVFQLRFPCR